MSDRCDICGEKVELSSVCFIEDVYCTDGYLSDAIICTECKEKYQHILDRGTDAFAEFLEKLDK